MVSSPSMCFTYRASTRASVSEDEGEEEAGEEEEEEEEEAAAALAMVSTMSRASSASPSVTDSPGQAISWQRDRRSCFTTKSLLATSASDTVPPRQPASEEKRLTSASAQRSS